MVNLLQIQTGRPSYINAILIASRGVPVPEEICSHTRTGHPFAGSVRLPGFFGGACANCKWRDHASRCPLGVEGEPRFEPTEMEEEEEEEVPVSLVVELDDD